ncbi:DUF3885 domain-containing protein [Ureibacillus aquaedulcis]|uniref:DUF3885 domain-containing protein n=1 Tax=Ureibacillus aquaedulcis TaxID=3058421 RepID=A0ABT8GN54_9BACL|nr:hypothetical protein [Ureibacillus sp. BA0131]MDN4492834.1 hypothetical protein [Ureibacillus sp. BA0131]
MDLHDFMMKNYNGLSLTPDLYDKWDNAIHIDLGNDIYQFDNHQKLNMERFHTVYQQVSEITSFLFKTTDDVVVVVNSYPYSTKKGVYPNFFRRFFKNQQSKYSLRLHEFYWKFEGEFLTVQQMSLLCKVSDLRVKNLYQALIHEDFHSLKPRLRSRDSQFAPDVFIVNLNNKSIFHLYDDRGCEILNADIKVHKKLLEIFKGLEIQAKPTPNS